MRPSVVVLAGLLAAPALHAAEPPKRPNILLVYADDQSYKTVGCYPESWPWVKTPHIDALAQSGVRFHGAYLGGWCMPSRASMLTGHHPHGIQSMRMYGPYPGSTYDPKQCPLCEQGAPLNVEFARAEPPVEEPLEVSRPHPRPRS